MIVLAAPDPADPVYSHRLHDIVQAQTNLACAALDHGEEVLILAEHFPGRRALEKRGALFLNFHVGDIWIRDFAPIVGAAAASFAYAPFHDIGHPFGERKTLGYAKTLQDRIFGLLQSCGISDITKSNIIMDGGHVLIARERGNSTGLVSHRVLQYNRRVPGLREQIQEILRLDQMIWVYDPGDATGHLDGTMAFLEPDLLLLQDTGHAGRASKRTPTRAERISNHLRREFSQLRQLRLDVPAEDGSAMGLYGNCIVTDETIFLPQYETPEDCDAFDRIQNATEKTVVGVDVGPLAELGGSLRCLSWEPPSEWIVQLKGARKSLQVHAQ